MATTMARRLLLERAHLRLVRIAATIFRGDFPALHDRHELESVVSEAWLRLDSSLDAVSAEHGRAILRTRRRQDQAGLARYGQTAAASRPWSALSLRGEEGLDAPGDFQLRRYDPRPRTIGSDGEFHQEVASLAEDERQVVELLYYGGLTQAEIARVMGLHPRKVCRLWFSATQRLAEWADAFRELRSSPRAQRDGPHSSRARDTYGSPQTRPRGNVRTCRPRRSRSLLQPIQAMSPSIGRT